MVFEGINLRLKKTLEAELTRLDEVNVVRKTRAEKP
jgi:hypothetical protein